MLQFESTVTTYTCPKDSKPTRRWTVIEQIKKEPLGALLVATVTIGCGIIIYSLEPIMFPIYLFTTLPLMAIILIGITLQDCNRPKLSL